ncbi:MAG: phosphotransferase, partial [Actinomycetota bacterium]|nr:phosphotransferase [Actinomycetota bacterium]
GWLAAAAAAGALLPEVEGAADDLLAELGAALGGPPARPTLLHRDLHDKQVLVGAGASGAPSLGILDADLAAIGEPALDLANLLVHLDLRAAQGTVPVATAQACVEAVLAGYDPDDEVRRRLPAYALATRLRLLGVYAFRPASAPPAAWLARAGS